MLNNGDILAFFSVFIVLESFAELTLHNIIPKLNMGKCSTLHNIPLFCRCQMVEFKFKYLREVENEVQTRLLYELLFILRSA